MKMYGTAADGLSVTLVLSFTAALAMQVYKQFSN